MSLKKEVGEAAKVKPATAKQSRKKKKDKNSPKTRPKARFPIPGKGRQRGGARHPGREGCSIIRAEVSRG